MSEQTFAWKAERDKAIRGFDGELPSGQTENDVREAFLERPRIVLALLADVAEEKRAGKCRSAWAVVRHRLAALSAPDVQAVDSTDRELAIRNAAHWIRIALLHVDRESELLAALFDPGAMLHPWRSDLDLQERMLDLWRTHRETGEQLEQEAEARAERWRTVRTKVQTTSEREEAVDEI